MSVLGTEMHSRDADEGADVVDVVVVGAGFAGLYLLRELRSRGHSVRLLEAGDGVGGTWYWNRYPGARCDVESWHYSYSFDDELQQDWDWSERFATQPEILSYLEHVAERYDLLPDIRLSTRVTEARFDEARARWLLRSEDGYVVEAQFVLFATGNLSAAQVPDLPGRDDFAGTSLHTGQWPHEGVDFADRRVAVIGTGSSGVQVIPEIAKAAQHVTVFQRTPTYSIPARNHPLDPVEWAEIKSTYADHRNRAMTHPGGLPIVRRDQSAWEVEHADRIAEFEARWRRGGHGLPASFNDVPLDPAVNEMLCDFVRSKIEETVEDPTVAAKLKPYGFPFGAKRPCLDTGYYEAFNEPHVDLVDVNESKIVRVVPEGIETTDGLIEVDTIVYATGFDAMTGALMRIDIRGREGRALRDAWSAGPQTYLGLGTSGFPNLLIIAGPGSPAVLGNVVVTIEHHVGWVSDLIDRMRDERRATIEPTHESEVAWVRHVNELAAGTLFLKANSWYLGANIEGKPRVFMPYPGGIQAYQQTLGEVARADYRGFVFAPPSPTTSPTTSPPRS